MEFIGSKDVQMAGLNTELSSREDDALPALLIKVPSQTIAGFDCVVGADDATVSLDELDDKVEELQQGAGTTTKDIVIRIPAAAPASAPPPRVIVAPARAYDDDDARVPYSVSLSMPASPSGFHLSQFMCADHDHARVAPADDAHHHPVAVEEQQVPEAVHSPRLIKQTRFHSQPILNLHPSSSKNVVDEARQQHARQAVRPVQDLLRPPRAPAVQPARPPAGARRRHIPGLEDLRGGDRPGPRRRPLLRRLGRTRARHAQGKH